MAQWLEWNIQLANLSISLIHSSRLARGILGLVVLAFAHQIDTHEEVIHEYHHKYSSCVMMWRVTSSQKTRGDHCAVQCTSVELMYIL